MASNPPGKCCTKGFLHEGTPTGETFKINGELEAYIARPKDNAKTDKAVLFLPDIFGIWQNSKIMADAFAAKGYTALIVDLFNGDQLPLQLPENLNIMEWFQKGSDGNNPHTPEHIDPVIVKGIEYLKSIGIKRIGSVGYCIGAKYVIRHYKSGVNVGFAAHPSFVSVEELQAFEAPLSIAAAETDNIFSTEKRHESEEVLAKGSQPYQINLFSGVEHGFAIRGDPSVQAQKFAKEQAFEQAIAWFEEHL
jgi:dienelactone hydrolase